LICFTKKKRKKKRRETRADYLVMALNTNTYSGLQPAIYSEQSISRSMDRNLENLYVHTDTLSCALRQQCICCFYKLFPLGGRNMPPNVRPEMCPRSKAVQFPNGLYNSSQSILTVGDGYHNIAFLHFFS
jgi:hypothetical protein